MAGDNYGALRAAAPRVDAEATGDAFFFRVVVGGTPTLPRLIPMREGSIFSHYDHYGWATRRI
jgi:hypothetical protein